jgi:hypothetical protein
MVSIVYSTSTLSGVELLEASASELDSFYREVLRRMAGGTYTGTIIFGNAQGSVIGNFTDTARASGEGGSNVDIVSNVYTLSQIQSTQVATDPPYFIGLNLVGNTTILQENKDTHANVAAEILSVVLSGGITSYYLGESAPSDGDTWVSRGSIQDTFNNFTEVQSTYHLWQKIDSGTSSYISPSKLVSSELQVFSVADIDNTIKIVEDYINSSGKNYYVLQESAPENGVWEARGTIYDLRRSTDTIYLTPDGYILTYDSINYIADYLKDAVSYTGPFGYDNVYTGPGDIAYTGEEYLNETYTGPIFYTGPINYTLDTFFNSPTSLYNVIYENNAVPIATTNYFGPGGTYFGPLNTYTGTRFYDTDYTSFIVYTNATTFIGDIDYTNDLESYINFLNVSIYTGASNLYTGIADSTDYSTIFVGESSYTLDDIYYTTPYIFGYDSLAYQIPYTGEFTFLSEKEYIGGNELDFTSTFTNSYTLASYTGDAASIYNSGAYYTNIVEPEYATFDTFSTVYTDPDTVFSTFATFTVVNPIYTGTTNYNRDVPFVGPGSVQYIISAYYTGTDVYIGVVGGYYTGNAIYARDTGGAFESLTYLGSRDFAGPILYTGPNLTYTTLLQYTDPDIGYTIEYTGEGGVAYTNIITTIYDQTAFYTSPGDQSFVTFDSTYDISYVTFLGYSELYQGIPGYLINYTGDLNYSVVASVYTSDIDFAGFIDGYVGPSTSYIGQYDTNYTGPIEYTSLFISNTIVYTADTNYTIGYVTVFLGGSGGAEVYTTEYTSPATYTIDAYIGSTDYSSVNLYSESNYNTTYTGLDTSPLDAVIFDNSINNYTNTYNTSYSDQLVYIGYYDKVFANISIYEADYAGYNQAFLTQTNYTSSFSEDYVNSGVQYTGTEFIPYLGPIAYTDNGALEYTQVEGVFNDSYTSDIVTNYNSIAIGEVIEYVSSITLWRRIG